MHTHMCFFRTPHRLLSPPPSSPSPSSTAPAPAPGGLGRVGGREAQGLAVGHDGLRGGRQARGLEPKLGRFRGSVARLVGEAE